MTEKKISPAVIHRLPRYYRYLSELMDEGVERISSSDLSERMHVTASQIRQDLNNFGGFGQQGYGYQVESLKDEIGHILGIDKRHRVIIIGAGNLGRALANYQGFIKRGFKIVGIFDRDHDLHGRNVGGLFVRSMEDLKDFLSETPADIAALTLSKTGALEVAEKVVELGVRGIWNFTSCELLQSEKLKNSDVKIENVHLAESLMRLSYALNDGVVEDKSEE